jgi:hypothetical protein
MSAIDNYLASLAEQQASVDAKQTGLVYLRDNRNKYPWIYPPASYQAFDYQGAIAMPTAGSGDTNVFSFPVPFGWRGVIKRISCNITGGGFNQGSGDILWRITADGRAIKGYDQILTELGSIQFPRPTDGILVYSNQLIALVTNNVNIVAAAVFVLGSLAGYFWPEGEEG